MYVGLTNNIPRRLSEHNEGKNKTTKPYAPFYLFYSEICSDRPTARLREIYLKSGAGKSYLKSKLAEFKIE
ncbi:MAG: GIY-YIG nuclease family protein [Saprospiraceae bacterium]|nr:GIY-YIG nuclease family protein [Saprospiraceae bacterium]